MSAVRAFLRFVAEQQGAAAALPKIASPKRPRTLPRPAAPADALALAEETGALASQPWIAARDTALLLLLYGAGLRIAEALSLPARVHPLGETLRVTGKRGKTRIVAILPVVADAIAALRRAVSVAAWHRTNPCFAAPKAVRSAPTWYGGRWPRRGARWV